MTKSIIRLAIAVLLIAPCGLWGQVVVGGTMPDPSATLDVQSSSQGVLLPRLTATERDAIISPATSLVIFNTTTNCLEINLGTPAASDWVRMKCRSGVVSMLDCSSAVVSGSLVVGTSASGVSADVPYTGGNGAVYDTRAVTSTGITGLTATLSAGNLASGPGTLTYTITGTPSGTGTASFALSIGGQSCSLDVTVTSAPVCRAKVTATDFKDFMCYNLGAANTSADPFTPSWEINGGYWQWGRPAEAAPGPTGPGTGETNGNPISGWNTTYAADGSWDDGSKTANDPCPSGFRVPTKAQWDGVVANNTKTNLGTFLFTPTNYSSGKKFGGNLMLPAAGYRFYLNGAKGYIGSNGGYWTSTENGSDNAWYLIFGSSEADTLNDYNRSYGFSVRCIAE
jgi:uncharacterized protein (TIGR02145 family)